MDNVENLIAGIGGVGIAVYIFVVVFNGNTQQLITLLSQEESYLEFIVAILIIMALMKWGPSSILTDILIVGVVLGLLFRISTKVQLPTILSKFANGQATGLQTIQAIAQGI